MGDQPQPITRHRGQTFINKCCTKFCLIPQRYVLGIMCCFAIFVSYSVRTGYSVQLTAMCKPIGENATTYTGRIPYDKLYNWDNIHQGYCKSAFFWGYFLSHIPAGLFAEHYGCKHILGFAMLMSFSATIITPIIMFFENERHALYCMIFLRLLVGLGQGPLYPAMNVIMAQWVPKNERSRIGSLSFSGAMLGTVFSNSLSGVVVDSTKTWEYPSYIFGFGGLLWFALWSILCYNDPTKHPFISQTELDFLAENVKISHEPQKLPPWKAMFSNVPFWALFGVQWGHDWGFYSIIADLPKFMKDVLDYDISNSGYMSALPHLMMWFFAMSSGWICDWLIDHEKMTITNARKLFTTISQTGPAVFLILAGMPGIRNWGTQGTAISVFFFTLGYGLMGTFLCGFKVNSLEIAPNYAGTVCAITNGMGALTGMISPIVSAALTNGVVETMWQCASGAALYGNDEMQNGHYTFGSLNVYRTVAILTLPSINNLCHPFGINIDVKGALEMAWWLSFWIAFTMLVSFNILFVIFGSSEIQAFNDL